MSDSEDKPDLGLSELINSLEASEPKEVVAEDPEVASEELQPDEEECQDEHEILFAKGDFEELIKFCEKTLKEELSPEEILFTRAWWLRAQLKLRKMPMLVLAGPLDETFTAYLELEDALQQKYQAVIYALVEESVGRFEELSDYEFGIEFGLRGVAIGNTAIVPQILQFTEKRIEELTVDEKTSLRNEEKLNDLRDIKKQLSLNPEVDRVLEKVQESSEDRIQTNLSERDTLREEGKKSSFRTVYRTVFLLLLLLVGVGSYHFLSSSPNTLRIAATSSSTETFQPELIQPQADFVESVSELDAILYGVSSEKPTERRELDAIERELERPVKRAPASYRDKPKPERAAPSASKSQDRPAPKSDNRRIALDMSGPLEPRHIREAALGERKSNKVERPNSVDVRGHFQNRNGSRAYEDGYVKFSRSILYRVITRGTGVHGEPDADSREISRLRNGDQVLVEGRVGQWLRLRSRSGRHGYVTIQDVEPVG